MIGQHTLINQERVSMRLFNLVGLETMATLITFFMFFLGVRAFFFFLGRNLPVGGGSDDMVCSYYLVSVAWLGTGGACPLLADEGQAEPPVRKRHEKMAQKEGRLDSLWLGEFNDGLLR